MYLMCSFDICWVFYTEFNSTEREQLAFCLGKYEKDSIVKDCVEVSSLFKYIKT